MFSFDELPRQVRGITSWKTTQTYIMIAPPRVGGLSIHTYNLTLRLLNKKHFLYFLDYGRKQIVPSVIFSTVDIMHFLSYRKMFRACCPSTISYRMEVDYIHSRKDTLGIICIKNTQNSYLQLTLGFS